jgi:ribosome maturation factor RimP
MRAQSELETRILGMIEPSATALGLDIVRIRVTGSRRPTLQIMAEKHDGTVDVEDCAKLSRKISPILEAEDPIAGEYALEVSSPGIDRPLTRVGDFGKWVGHEVRIEIAYPVDGRRRFHGFIDAEKDGVVTVTLKEGGVAAIPVSEMSKAHLVLTDKLIKQTQDAGLAADLAEDDEIIGFDEVEVEEDIEDEALAEAAAQMQDKE